MIRFVCPACAQTYTVPDDKAGRTAACKKCGRPVTVPKAAGDLLVPDNTGSTRRRRASTPRREEAEAAESPVRRPRPSRRVVLALAGISLAGLAFIALGVIFVRRATDGPLDEDPTRARLERDLPEGTALLVVYRNGLDGGELHYEVAWSRPGYGSGNLAGFTVRRKGDVVMLRHPIFGGEWTFTGTTMTGERAPASHPEWDWVRARAKEVALVTAKLPR